MASGAELGSAFINVGLSTGTLAQDIRRTFDSSASDGEAGGRRSGLGFMKGLGGALAAVGGAAAIGSFFKNSISAAGDLEQSVGGVSAVFKEGAGQVLEYSAGAARAIGLTSNEYNQLATVIGSQLKNGGVAIEELGGKTNDLIGVGGDLAAMFGGTTSEAVGALSSALKGERDPIEKYGVSLTQAAIDAKAAELGFKKVGGSLSAEANQAATMAIIMEQTADAHGAAGRESETFAARLQQMKAGFGNLQATIGSYFLPILASAFGFISQSVIPNVESFIATLGSGDNELTGVLRNVGAVVGPVFQQLASAFGPVIPQVMSLMQAFSPLGLLFQVITPILPMLAGAFGTIGAAVGQVLQQVIPLATSLVATLVPIIVQLVTAILPPLAAMFVQVANAVVPLVKQIAGALIPMIQNLMPVVVTVFSVVSNVIQSAMRIIQGIINVVIGVISGNWSQVWQGIGQIFSGIWNTIVAVLRGVMQIIGAAISGGLNNARAVVGSVLGAIGSFFAGTWNNILGGVSGFIGGFIGFFRGLPGQIMGALSGAAGWLLGIGRNIVQGLINGITGMAGTVARAILNLIPAAIRGPIEAALGIHSPSRVAMWWMEMIGAGFVKQAPTEARRMQNAMDTLFTVPGAPNIPGGSSSSGYDPVGAGENRAAGGGFVQNVYPTPGMSEETVAELSARKILRAGVGV